MNWVNYQNSYRKLKEDHDNELTKEEIDLIGSHLDKEIEDLKPTYQQ